MSIVNIDGVVLNVDANIGSAHYSNNRIDPEKITFGKAVKIQAGTGQGDLIDSTTDCACDYCGTDMFEVGKKYYWLFYNLSYKKFVIADMSIAYYDQNKSCLSATKKAYIEMPTGAAYVRYSYRPSSESVNIGKNMVVCEDVLQNYENGELVDFEPFEKYGDNDADSAWKLAERATEIIPSLMPDTLHGKRMLGWGDSIMFGLGSLKSGFLQIIAERHGMYYVNNGVSASTWPQIHSRIVSTYAQYLTKDVDYILLSGQINDAIAVRRSQESRGDVTSFYEEDGTNEWDTSTYAGAVEKSLSILTQNFPNAKIIFVCEHKMLPIPVEDQKTIYDMCRTICDKWSIPIADIWGRLDMHYTLYKELFTQNNARQAGFEGWDEKAATASAMTDVAKKYLYTGSEENMNSGFIYAYVDGAWTGVCYLDGTHPNTKGYNMFYVPLVEGAMLYG